MQRLIREREEAAAQVQDLAGELAAIMESAAGDIPDDEHDAEGSTVGYERARVSALLDHARRCVAELDQALDQTRRGTYGRCGECGDPIGEARLEALPATRRCIRCARGRGGIS